MNCDTDGLAEKFRKLMDDGDVKPLKEGFFTDLMEVGILVDEVKMTSHLLHQIQLKIQAASTKSIYRTNMAGTIPNGTVLIGKELSPDSCHLAH